jgi:hypothetical protein
MDKETETVINQLSADKKMAIDLVDYLIKENVKLRETLMFYASFADALPHENIAPLMVDRGNKARAALKKGE